MAIRRVSRKVEFLEIDGSEVHAVKPDKSAWDEYSDALFARDATSGEIALKNSRGLRALYRTCIRLLKNVEVQEADGSFVLKSISDPDEIEDFIMHITDRDTSIKIDSWLLGLGEMTKDESKNSNGERPVLPN
jgi:hypothetical protein